MQGSTTSRRALLRAASTAVAYATGAAIVGTGMALAGEVHAETLPSLTLSHHEALIAEHNRLFWQVNNMLSQHGEDSAQTEKLDDYVMALERRIINEPARDRRDARAKLGFIVHVGKTGCTLDGEDAEKMVADALRFISVEG